MNLIQKRFVLFLFGCIGTRTLITLLAKNINIDYLPILGYIALIVAFGFSYIYVTGSRTHGIEVGGEKIWWNSLRPIHAFLFFLFSYAAITKNTHAWKILAIDTILGLLAFLSFHYSQNNFTKLDI